MAAGITNNDAKECGRQREKSRESMEAGGANNNANIVAGSSNRGERN